MPTKILVIDDDQAITDLMAMLLKTHGFEAIVSNNGKDGVRVTKEKNPDIIILDLMMPDMDGWQVCKAIRTFSNTPILILSAINDPSMVASVLDAGADDFLVKPVPSGVLIAHVKKIARRAHSTDDSPKKIESASHPRNTAPIPSRL